MARYVIQKETGYYDYDAPMRLFGLMCDDSKYTHTGLFDSQGNQIVRLPPPIGFGRDDEW